jgi:hypothetical protein
VPTQLPVVVDRYPTVAWFPHKYAVLPLVVLAVSGIEYPEVYPNSRVPEVVMGLPVIVNPVGTEASTDSTVPEPPPVPTIPRLEVATLSHSAPLHWRMYPVARVEVETSPTCDR